MESGRFDAETVPVHTAGTAERAIGDREQTRQSSSRANSRQCSRDGEAATSRRGRSPLTDGAAGMLVTSAAYADQHGLDVLGRIETRSSLVSTRWSWDGDRFRPRVLHWTMPARHRRYGLVEINEAFASQEYSRRELGIDERLNVNGGARVNQTLHFGGTNRRRCFRDATAGRDPRTGEE